MGNSLSLPRRMRKLDVDHSSTLNQPDQNRNYRDYQQNMNKSADGVRRDHP